MHKFFILPLTLLSFSCFCQDTIKCIAYTPPLPVINFETPSQASYFLVNGANNIWQIGSSSKIIANSLPSPTHALFTDTANFYPNNTSSPFEFVVQTDDLTLISFTHRFNTDTLADGGVIEVSTNGGATYTNIISSSQFTLTNFYSPASTITSNGNQPAFTGNSVWMTSVIKGYALNCVRFRFKFTSDSINTNKEGWVIDNLSVVCYGTGIEEQDFEKGIRLFPNPANDFVTVGLPDNQQITNISVKTIIGTQVLNSGNSLIDIRNLAKGIYIIEVTSGDKKLYKRIVKD